VNTTASFTQHWTNCPPEHRLAGGGAFALGKGWCIGLTALRRIAVWLAGGWVCGLILVGTPAGAAVLQQVAVQRVADGIQVSARIDFAPSPAMEEALTKSVPLYFVVQADVLRERWYWTDKRLSSASRTYRLAFQPLSRQWRVSVATGAGPGGGLQYALHQNHDNLNAALASITRLANWQVAEATRVEGESDLVLDFRFRLDLALLPRPFQLGTNAQSEWNLDLRRRLAVPDTVQPGQGLMDPPDPEPAGATGSTPVKTP